MSEVTEVLQEGRRRERAQALFYRALAGDAELADRPRDAERLNELLADEQHHVSRLTARLLEMGETPADEVETPASPALDGWEVEARRREEAEVVWYRGALDRVTDQETRSILEEILASERHHREELGGKWMPAAHEERAEREEDAP